MLVQQLYKTKFVYFVGNDIDRAYDGIELREEFLDIHEEYAWDPDWISLECSVLEMLVALARVADFETDAGAMRGGVMGWFWTFLDNVKLKGLTDSVWGPRVLEDVTQILQQVNNREYDANGCGGYFPLRNSKEDQRYVELWYQLSAYLLENNYVAQ